MKHGTAYAKRLKRFYGRIKKVDCPADLLEPADPLEQLVISILSLETSRAQARRALTKLLVGMVDVNEIRVSPPRQVAAVIAPYVPNSLDCASRLCAVLNAVFNSQNTLKLDALKSIGKREARHRLEKLDRIEPYCIASVLLFGLGGHAVPVNERSLEALRREEIVEPNSPVAEVQAFLERHISPADAKVFSLSLEYFASQPATAKAKAQSNGNGSREPLKSTGKRQTARSTGGRRVSSKR